MVKLKEQKMKKEARKTRRTRRADDEEVLKFRKEYEKSMRQPARKPKTKSDAMPKSQRGRRRKTPQEIREEMLKKLEDSNLK